MSRSSFGHRRIAQRSFAARLLRWGRVCWRLACCRRKYKRLCSRQECRLPPGESGVCQSQPFHPWGWRRRFAIAQFALLFRGRGRNLGLGLTGRCPMERKGFGCEARSGRSWVCCCTVLSHSMMAPLGTTVPAGSSSCRSRLWQELNSRFV